jgi:hypothetical protein
MIGKINTFSGFTNQYKICKLARGTYIIIKCGFKANETRPDPRHNVKCTNIKIAAIGSSGSYTPRSILYLLR